MVDVARPGAGSSSLEETLSSLSDEVCTRSHVIAPSCARYQAVLDLQEINKFSMHLKDPKFMELFADYAKELADPKVTFIYVAITLHSLCQ